MNNNLIELINLNINKTLKNSMKNIYGIGYPISNKILIRIGISYLNNIKKKNLSSIKKINLINFVSNCLNTGEFLKIFINDRFKLFTSIKNYKFYRITWGYPVRGQRTRSNSKTSKRSSLKYFSLKK